VGVRSSAGGGCDAASLEFYRHRDEIDLLLAVAGSPAATIQEQPAWSRSTVRAALVEHRRLHTAAAQQARQLRALGPALDPDPQLLHPALDSSFVCSGDMPARRS
jgi:hypothetical protein